eukprot:1730319-Amphidinium_carterae.1
MPAISILRLKYNCQRNYPKQDSLTHRHELWIMFVTEPVNSMSALNPIRLSPPTVHRERSDLEIHYRGFGSC